MSGCWNNKKSGFPAKNSFEREVCSSHFIDKGLSILLIPTRDDPAGTSSIESSRRPRKKEVSR